MCVCTETMYKREREREREEVPGTGMREGYCQSECMRVREREILMHFVCL